MNKLLLFPLIFLFILTVVSFIFTSALYTSETTNYTELSGVTIDDEEKEIEIDESTQQTVDIWDASQFIIIIVIALGVSIVAGIQFIGSGLTILSQKMLFNSIVFMGLWGCLSLISADLLFINSYTSLSWIILTVCYFIGFGAHVSESDSANV
jgi:hypothetical protein